MSGSSLISDSRNWSEHCMRPESVDRWSDTKRWTNAGSPGNRFSNCRHSRPCRQPFVESDTIVGNFGRKKAGGDGIWTSSPEISASSTNFWNHWKHSAFRKANGIHTYWNSIYCFSIFFMFTGNYLYLFSLEHLLCEFKNAWKHWNQWVSRKRKIAKMTSLLGY